MTAIEARNLTRQFGELVAMNHLSFQVAPGEIVGLLGANGAGKTTAMRLLLGLLAPTSGQVIIDGQPVSQVDRGIMGYVPQGLGLYPDLTVAENIEFAATAFGVPVPSTAGTGLAELSARKVGELSLGMKRRVAFVVARCHQPRILILDEPTSGVGPLGRARLWETIHETAEEGAAVLVSTHYMEEAEECDRVILMAAGREVASGSVAEVIADARSVALSGGVTEDALDAIREAGAKVLVDASGWRVVGSDATTVKRLAGPGADVSEVPASFEEAFVALST